MRPSPAPNYLSGYPDELVAQVRRAIENGRLGPALLHRYPDRHAVRTDRALYEYVQALKARHLRSAAPLSKIVFDGTLQTLQRALGTHTAISRVQGGKLKAKREIRIATVFRDLPDAFLEMIVAHELAHLKVREHDRAFYQLCQHIQPGYHQVEFDLRAYLSYLAAGGAPLWDAPAG